MESITELVRNVAIIVLTAAVAEMLLPNNDMARYLRMLMGLFMLVAVLTPILAFLKPDASLEVGAWQYSSGSESELNTILAKGEQIRLEVEKKAKDDYRLHLERQVAALARLVPGIAWASAEVEMGQDVPEKVQGITVTVEWGENNDLIAVPEVKVGLEESEKMVSGAKAEAMEKVRMTVADFYGLPKGRIKVLAGQANEEKGGD